MTDFDRAAAVTRVDVGHFRAETPMSWRSSFGRPQGGIVAAQMMLAMIETIDDPTFHPRAITTHYLRSPESGPLEIECTIERKGRTILNMSSKGTQDGSPHVLCLAVFGRDRNGFIADELPIPRVDPPDAARASTAYHPPQGYPFADHVVVQQRAGSKALTGPDAEMYTAGWIGFTDPRPFDAPALLTLCDAGLMPHWSRRPLPTTTLDYTVHFRANFPKSYPDELVVIENRTHLVRDGLMDWNCVVWGPDGDVLCLTRQQLLALDE